jgi:hypothetical protein
METRPNPSDNDAMERAAMAFSPSDEEAAACQFSASR